MKIDVKTLNKILENWIQQEINRIIYHEQVGFNSDIQEWLNLYQQINVIYHNKSKFYEI
jgi:hypothetical protein